MIGETLWPLDELEFNFRFDDEWDIHMNSKKYYMKQMASSMTRVC